MVQHPARSSSSGPTTRAAGNCTRRRTTPGNCGLICSPAPKAKIDLTAPAHLGPLGLIQGQPFTIAYTVTNTSSNELVGYVGVAGNGQLLPDVRVGAGTGYGLPYLPSGNSQQLVTLAPQQQFTGMVLVNPAPTGDFSIVASYDAPLQCNGQLTIPGGTTIPLCIPRQRFATAATSVEIAPDADSDGISDILEQQLLTQYAPLMLFSRDHGSEEKYRPIDVIDYLAASTLVSKQKSSPSDPTIPNIPSLDNAVLQKSPTAILGPEVTQPNNDCILTADHCDARIATYRTVTMPLQLFVSPSDRAKQGSSWEHVLSQGNVGLYGHVVLVPVSSFPDPSIRVSLAAFLAPNVAIDAVKLLLVTSEYYSVASTFSYELSTPSATSPGRARKASRMFPTGARTLAFPRWSREEAQ
jgi:hypothetical protein